MSLEGQPWDNKVFELLHILMDPSVNADDWILSYDRFSRMDMTDYHEDVSTHGLQGLFLRRFYRALGSNRSFYEAKAIVDMINDILLSISDSSASWLDLRLLPLLNPSAPVVRLIQNKHELSDYYFDRKGIELYEFWTVLLRHSLLGPTTFAELGSKLINHVLDHEKTRISNFIKSRVTDWPDDLSISVYEKDILIGRHRTDPLLQKNINTREDLLEESFSLAYQGSSNKILMLLADAIQSASPEDTMLEKLERLATPNVTFALFLSDPVEEYDSGNVANEASHDWASQRFIAECLLKYRKHFGVYEDRPTSVIGCVEQLIETFDNVFGVEAQSSDDPSSSIVAFQQAQLLIQQFVDRNAQTPYSSLFAAIF